MGASMNFGFPWSVKGVRPDARRNAEEAARRAGLPLNDWLNAVILDQAASKGIRPSSRNHRGDETADNLSDLRLRLDDLARRIDQITRSGSAAYAPKRDREEPDRFAELFVRLDQRLDQLADKISRSPPGIQGPGVDRAVAEIAARRYLLAGEPTHDLTRLEGQLRKIGDQIETLRRPAIEEAIETMRSELGEIGRTLDETLPRGALEIIEKQIQDLGYRIEDGHQAGVDRRALSAIEHELAEIRDAVRGLMPAENLIGCTEAIDALAHKIDLIVTQRDPATIRELEKSIDSLCQMTAHVASSEAVTGLSTQVQALADKIEHLATGGAANNSFNRLEIRIDALSRAVSEIANNGVAVPPRFETLFQSLADKIEKSPRSYGDQIAFGHLENLIAKLVERLNATDARLGHLDAVERGLADLLIHIESIRSNKETDEPGTGDGFEPLKEDMARAKDVLDRIADRIAQIEKDIRSEQSKPPVHETGILELAKLAAACTSAASVSETSARLPPATELQKWTGETTREQTVASPRPLVNLPGDLPLEPGSGRPGFATHPGMRIAASEAALGIARPNGAAAGSKSNFIAAARRAAQAASQDPKSRQARNEPHKTAGGENPVRSRVATRAKGMLLAASIVAIIVGSIQFTSNIFDFGIFDSTEARLAANFASDAEKGDGAAQSAEIETTAGIAGDKSDTPRKTDGNVSANLLAPPTLPSLTPAPQGPNAGNVAIALPPNLFDTGDGASQALNPPLLNPPSLGTSTPKNDVTGSVARPPAEARPNRQPTPAISQPATDGLPASIGGARLRNAASAGDPAAAYEVAMRYLEGRGVPANLEEAARWYERAASKGLTPAQFRYASMLEKGQGAKKDLVAAQKLYVAAASKGHAKAMHNLAVLYAEGAEGKPDYANAALWFRKAAEHGVADSQYNFAVLAARGIGTEKNLADAYKWFALAAAQGDRDAGRKRDDVASHLDAQALASAQEAVKNFVVQAQPATATIVPEPAGGWDRATPPPHEKPRAAGPFSISAFNSGKL
jgi:localization factor PodJL